MKCRTSARGIFNSIAHMYIYITHDTFHISLFRRMMQHYCLLLEMSFISHQDI